MRNILLLFCALLLPTISHAQHALNQYLDEIRQQPAALRAFFQSMPKGGDLHHHYSGSIYAETYWQWALEANYWIHTQSLTLVQEVRPKPDKTSEWRQLTSLRPDELSRYREQVLRLWSVKDFQACTGTASHDHFFNTFGYFGTISGINQERGLLELKKRAVQERVQYLETMLERVPCSPDLRQHERYNTTLRTLQAQRNERALHDTLQALYQQLLQQNIVECATRHNSRVREMHERQQLDDSVFMMRYQNYVVRVVSPVELFMQLIISFQSVAQSELLVGVNIVAPEHNAVALQDYWLHMQMFKFCKRLFPQVKCALHAGELTPNIATPEDLTWHIREAVLTASAQRIGHGVDIAHEQNAWALLDTMRARQIAVEINLTSNAFILNIPPAQHPFPLYYAEGVPLVISTDDAGVLRSDLTQQYVLLAQHYPMLSYENIKQLVFNSIAYSFTNPSDKEKLLTRLTNYFLQFEQTWEERLNR